MAPGPPNRYRPRPDRRDRGWDWRRGAVVRPIRRTADRIGASGTRRMIRAPESQERSVRSDTGLEGAIHEHSRRSSTSKPSEERQEYEPHHRPGDGFPIGRCGSVPPRRGQDRQAARDDHRGDQDREDLDEHECRHARDPRLPCGNPRLLVDHHRSQRGGCGIPGECDDPTRASSPSVRANLVVLVTQSSEFLDFFISLCGPEFRSQSPRIPR